MLAVVFCSALFSYKARAADVEAPSQLVAAPQSAAQLMKDVIYNELHDRERNSFWQYRSHVVTPKKDILREQIETPHGPVFLILARDGRPLTGAAQAAEQARLTAYLRSPSAIARIRREHEADEKRLAHMMALIPVAYQFEYEGQQTGPHVLIRFWPNPAYSPSGYEDRILHGLSGQIVVDQTIKRLVSIDGKIEHKIDFGFGLLGYVNPGGSFVVTRTEVSPTHWKTNQVDVDVVGRILLLSEVSKVQRETRWDFEPVPQSITLAEAAKRLEQARDSYLAHLPSPAASAEHTSSPLQTTGAQGTQ